MKIIAKTSNAYMVEATKGELALIMGFKGQYGTDFKDDMVQIGREIEIQRIDQVAHFIRTLDKQKLNEIKGRLEGAIKEIDNAVEQTQALRIFEELKEED